MRIDLTVPEVRNYFTPETFLGAGTTFIAGEELSNRLLPLVMQYLPVTGDIATATSIAVKALLGYGAFYVSKQTSGLPSKIAMGAAFGLAGLAFKDLVYWIWSKISGYMPTTAAVRYAPRTVTVRSMAPAPSPVGVQEAPELL